MNNEVIRKWRKRFSAADVAEPNLYRKYSYTEFPIVKFDNRECLMNCPTDMDNRHDV